MTSNWLSCTLMGVAFVVTTLIYPYVLAFARKHHIVDNPSARKLQRVPVPVMGGTAVFIGFLITVIIGCCFAPEPRIWKIMSLLTVMYAIGVWDDIKDISAALRFLVELLVVWLMILLLGVEINDFHGLWGIHEIPDVVSVPFSLVAGVGIMNAVNLIDGVDGYCSTYGVMACTAFSVIFWNTGDVEMFTLALIGIGAVIPFFFHNVFGSKSKMFLGDGGSLMLGTLLTIFAFSCLSSNSPCALYGYTGISLPALVLAILAVPVFDTLKVMIGRVARGQSPFRPDKSHLHHLFIEMNFSHLATSGIIVFSNLVILAILIMIWWLNASVDLQLYVVVLCSLLFTWVFYFMMDHERRKNDGDGSVFWQYWCKRGKKSNIATKPFWQFIRKVVDSKMLGGKEPEPEKKNDSEKLFKGVRLDPRIGAAIDKSEKE